MSAIRRSSNGGVQPLSRTQIILLGLTTALGYTTWGLLISLQPPFYPLEAEKKGAKPQQYGFVFGIFNLMAFLTAPLFGRYGTRLGATNLYRFGAFVQAICGIGFGFLQYVDNLPAFLGLSYLLRALSGIADAAGWSSVLSILMQLFPTKVARIMAWTETFFGLGFMIGPALGSLLYGLGGFQLPFFMVGGAALAVATAMLFVLPKVEASESTDELARNNSISYSKVIKCPTLLLPFLDVLVCFLGNGLIESMLQPYAVDIGASVTQVGVIFLALGGSYMLVTPVAGVVCDKIGYPSMVALLGNLAMVIAFTFLAPLPFLPMVPTIGMINVSTAIAGIGIAFTNVSAFTRAQNAAHRIGFDQDLKTHIMISGLFASCLFLGNFVGPTLSGILVESLDFQSASLFFWSCYILITALNAIDLVYHLRQGLNHKVFRNGYQSIDIQH